MNRIVLIMTLVTGPMAGWAQADCKLLKADLQQMLLAQKQILTSLNSNHETAASLLEEYAELASTADEKSDIVLSKKMNDSAKVFRTRGVQAQKIANTLNQASEDLAGRLQNCLK